MKKTVLITTLTFNLLLFTFNLKAQPTIQWEKSYGSSWLEFARSVQQTSDKGLGFKVLTQQIVNFLRLINIQIYENKIEIKLSAC